jgi:hypothetical protein
MTKLFPDVICRSLEGKTELSFYDFFLEQSIAPMIKTR